MNLIYSLPYIFFALFLFIMFLLRDRNSITEDSTRKIIGIFYLLFIGLRGFIGYDWYAYYPYFNSSPDIFDLKLDNFFAFLNSGESVEPGFVVYVAVIKTFFDNWFLFTLISTGIDLAIFNYFIKRFSPSYALSFLILFSFGLSMHVDLFRNIKALLFIILSFEYILNRSFFGFLVMILLAFMFHRTAIFFFPLYFLSRVNFTKKLLSVVFVGFVLIYLFDFPVFDYLFDNVQGFLGSSFQSKLFWYGQNEAFSSERGLTFGLFYRVLTFLLVIKFADKLVSEFYRGKLIIALFIMYSSLYFVFNDFEIIVFRFELLLGISLWVLWPVICDLLAYDNLKRKIATYFIVFICFFKVIKQTSNLMYQYDHALNSTNYDSRVQSHYNISDAVGYD